MKRRDHRNRQGQQHIIVVSNCGDVKIRGSIGQVIEKYKSLAADASDAAQKELFLQHADHYLRVMTEQRVQHVE